MRRTMIPAGILVAAVGCVICGAGCSALWFAGAEDLKDGGLIDE